MSLPGQRELATDDNNGDLGTDDHANRMIAPGHALVLAIEALGTAEPTGR